MSWQIDWDKLQLGDILLTTGPSIISGLIRSGEAWADEMKHFDVADALEDSVESWFDPTWPSHSLFVYDIKEMKGAEMTYPKVQYCDLNDYSLKSNKSHIVGAFRCPYLDDKRNPDSGIYLKSRLKNWIDEYIKQNTTYGLTNLLSFITCLPQDTKHPVCSIWTNLGIVKSVFSEGYDLNFPKDWIIADSDNSPIIGLVSPSDQLKVFNELGWGIQFKKFVK